MACHFVIGSVAAAFLIFVIGVVVASAIGFQQVYLSTSPVYLGVFGIAWVASWCGWASKRLTYIFGFVRPAFAMSDDDFRRFVQRWQRRFYNKHLHLGMAAAFTLAGWIFLAASISTESLPWFPVQWSQPPHKIAKAFILCVYTVGISLLLVTTGAGIVTYCAFVEALSRQRLIPFVEGVKIRLHPFTDFGVMTGIAWSIGVALFVLLFRPAFGPYNFAAITILTGLGLLMISTPQFFLHGALETLKIDLVYAAWRELGVGNEAPKFPALLSDSHGVELYDLLASMAAARTWVYSPTDTLVVVGTWIIPLLVLWMSGTPPVP